MTPRTRPQAGRTTREHRPVLLKEVLGILSPTDGATYVDGTFGAGGYTQALLDAADCTVWAIDRDPDAIEDGSVLLRSYARRLHLLEGRFGEMADLLKAQGVTQVDGIALDLGVSSMQLDKAGRGFSFRADGPLDMRMAKEGPSAADIVNQEDEQTLARILREYGEEKKSRRIARRIVELRNRQPITRTRELAELVAGVVKQDKSGIDPATRTFQALRIHVNDELGEIERGLRAAETLLKPQARIAVVAFHSLEDRIVKTFFRARSATGTGTSRHLPLAPKRTPSFRLLTKRATRPGEAETAANPRARSARLRAAERTEAAPWEHAA
ncbi:MAG: 16S rRNA (cytosine(1402)-N(4))-methyltransferase RsmH [Alphaproteobacteria bacterium]|nr:16S rRNA (cytosine(1402)-N(4))-methyltransferase RsmH [Alphaproteobacteria bacterium]